jgi:hypothetical protein
MDWKMLLIGAVMLVLGGFLAIRFRGSNYRTEMGPGCAMAFALLMILTGFLAAIMGLIFRG